MGSILQNQIGIAKIPEHRNNELSLFRVVLNKPREYQAYFLM